MTSEVGRSFDRQWAELAEIGRHAQTGGYRRYALTREDHDLREWFAGEATDRGLDLTLDRMGNQWAWWGDPDTTPGVVTGSHLDSVPDGGAYDGPLGVVSAFAALDRLRDSGFAAATTTRHRELRRRGGCPVRHRLCGLPGDHRRAGARAGAGAEGRRRPLHGRGAARGRSGSGADRTGPGDSASSGCLRRAARRTGPWADRSRPAGRAGHRHLAARAMAAGLPGRGQPRRHHPTGRPAGRHDRSGLDDPGRSFGRHHPRLRGHHRQDPDHPGRSQRHPVRCHRVAGRPGRRRSSGAADRRAR